MSILSLKTILPSKAPKTGEDAEACTTVQDPEMLTAVINVISPTQVRKPPMAPV